jgi:hypothetical protein
MAKVSICVRSPASDPANVDWLCGGGRPSRYTMGDMAAAVARLDAYGMNATQIAARLHISTRTVVRYRGRQQKYAQPVDVAA